MDYLKIADELGLGMAVKLKRTAEGKTTYDLGALLGVDQSNLSKYENGKRKIPSHLVIVFRRYLATK